MLKNRYLTSLLLTGSVLSQVITTGCAERVSVGYRVYDRYHTDYHRWDDNEVRFYGQWTTETKRRSGRDYKNLKRDEQREYWNWRHDRR